MKKFRVWCKDNKKWDKHFCFLGENGNLYQRTIVGGLIHCKIENHIVQFEIGKDDDNEQKLFEGDIVRVIYNGTLHRGIYIGIIESGNSGDGYYILIQEEGVSLFINDENIESIIKIGNEFENPELMM